MTCRNLVALALLSARFLASAEAQAPPREVRRFHPMVLTFNGPELAEGGDVNPFADYRLDVTFSQGARRIVVPGHYAADGSAAETSADRGGAWRAYFVPETAGEWSYRASFRKGKDVAVADRPEAGEPAGAFDGATGTFRATDVPDRAAGPRERGILRHSGGRYLRFSGTGEVFLKGGADSPENFLAFEDFDATRRPPKPGARPRPGEANPAERVHRYEPHVRDWKEGDPTWKGGKGKGIVGALNYLAGQGMNSVYFLTMNVEGDGRDVWPWVAPDRRDRFDVSKLDQWNLVFEHMSRLGLMLHVVTQETENDQLLDGGELGRERKLYYRELISRFAHHNMLVWNLGEENTNTDAQRKAFAAFIKATDPCDHPVVIHTYPGQYDKVYTPLLGDKNLDGPSLQTNDTHRQTLKWIAESRKAGRPWAVFLDEIGPADVGVKPDADDPSHDEVRVRHLWGHLMAGGAGVEWYFGYRFAHNDLNCEDWRSREAMWKQTRVALAFFREQIPFAEMEPEDGLSDNRAAYCLAKRGEVYALFVPDASVATTLDLGGAQGEFAVSWYDPRAGGDLKAGTVATLAGGGKRPIGQPPADVKRDWVAVVRRK